MKDPKRPKCPVCGKLFWCDYPNQWAYKRERVYFCSWRCMREWDKRGKEAKQMKTLTREEKQKAVQIALDGENPLQYLKELGCANPTTSWKTIRNWARGIYNQDKYEKLPESFGKKKEEPKIELVYDESIAEEYRKEQAQKEANERAKEAEKMIMSIPPVVIRTETEPDRRYLWTTTAIRNEYLGVFYYDRKYNTVDWRHPAGEEISLPPADWNLLANALPEIMRTFGVDQQEIEKEV